MRTWLDQVKVQVPPASATGNDLHYLHNEWHQLIRCQHDSRLEIDSNAAENAICPLAISGKTGLFGDSVLVVTVSTNLYPWTETATANGLETDPYLRHVHVELPAAQFVDAIGAPLPDNLDRDQIRI